MFTPSTELNNGNIAQQLAAGLAAIDAGQTSFDFNQTRQIDSSTVACLLAWKRHAEQRNAKLAFLQLPENLTRLIALYGVAEFL